MRNQRTRSRLPSTARAATGLLTLGLLTACTAASSDDRESDTGVDVADDAPIDADEDATTGVGETDAADTATDAVDVATDPAADAPETDAADAATDTPADAGSEPGLTAGNAPPVLATIGDRRIPAESSTVIQLVAQDPDGDEITFFASSLPDGARFDKTGGVFAWVPPARSVGRAVEVVFGVRDEHGAEDSRVVTLEVLDGTESNPPVFALPEDGLAWPANQSHVWAIPVSDPDGDRLTIDLLSGAPEGMTVDADAGLLAWTAGSEEIGETYSVALRARDRRGLDAEATLQIRVEGTPLDSLPAVFVAPGDSVSIDLIPDRDDLPRDAFSCSPVAGATPLPTGASIDDCMLDWSVSGADAGRLLQMRFAIDLVSSAASPDLVRTLVATVSAAPACSPRTTLPDAAIVLAFDDDGYAYEARELCFPEEPVTVEYNIILPADAQGVDALLVHDNNDTVDLDLRLVCRGVDEWSYGVSGEEFVSSSEVSGGADCRIDVASFGAVRVATEYEIIVDARLPDVTPECADDDSSEDTLSVGEVLEKRMCPGSVDAFTLDADVVRVDLSADEGADLDFELWAEGSDGEERLVDLAIALGSDETITVDRAELEAGERFVLRVIPFTVPETGVGYLIEGSAGE